MNSLGEAEAKFLRAKLQPFLSRNPEADVKTGGRELSVGGLWGEEAIEIPLRSDDDELLEALNAVRLPPLFTAIWHEDTEEFEVIFTVLWGENYLLERKFEFRYRGISHHCNFGPSSSRLRAIARKARPSGDVSPSGSRNLPPYNQFEVLLEDHPEADYVKNGRPTSFWIRGIDGYDDDRVGDLVRNLNFHMSYFDRQLLPSSSTKSQLRPLRPLTYCGHVSTPFHRSYLGKISTSTFSFSGQALRRATHSSGLSTTTRYWNTPGSITLRPKSDGK